jgi:hypothetical protein
MTTQKTFKRRVRARMAKTGESYTSARRMLIEARPADEKVVAATGRSWEAWFGLLDAAGAVSWGHTAMARWLREEHGVASWWSQSITVAFEQARGLRVPGQQVSGGFTATASRTVDVPVSRLFEAFDELALRSGLTLRTAIAPRSSRWNSADGASRVLVGFEAVSESRSRVALSHERLSGTEEREQMKRLWRSRLLELKASLEQAAS